MQSRRTKASLAAVFSIIGMACVPLSFAANRIWTQYHPTVIASEQGENYTLADTARSTLDWFLAHYGEWRDDERNGLSRVRTAEILAAWSA